MLSQQELQILQRRWEASFLDDKRRKVELKKIKEEEKLLGLRRGPYKNNAVFRAYAEAAAVETIRERKERQLVGV